MNTQSSPTTYKMILAVLAFLFLASFALITPAAAKTSVPGADNDIVPSFCTKMCVRVANISLAKLGTTNVKQTKGYVIAVVTVAQSPTPSKTDMAGILVTATWTLPNGDILKATGLTNAQGKATFQIEQVEGYGYTFTILDVDKTGFTFDKLNSVITKSIK